MSSLKKFIRNQVGFSLIEVLAAIVLLGMSLAILASFMYQNFMAIDLNTKKEEAIFIREDMKEWLTYKGQSQDIARLNPWVLSSKGWDTDAEEERIQNLIVDESGIQYIGATGKTRYDEIPKDQTIDRGVVTQKIQYDLTGNSLPDSLKAKATNRFYIGEYRNQSGELSGYLVQIKKVKADIPAAMIMLSYRPPMYAMSDYVPWVDDRKQGIGLKIIVYDKESGKSLTETFLYWVVEY